MKRIISIIVLCTSIIYISISCDTLYFKNYIKKDRIPQHELNDVYIYSSFDKTKTDSFTVTFMTDYYSDDEEVLSQVIGISLNSPRTSETYMQYEVFRNSGVIYCKNGMFTYEADDETAEFIIDGTKYKDVYVLEEETMGNSDTIINRIRYHGIVGVLTYRYENGEEFLLDTIIKAQTSN